MSDIEYGPTLKSAELLSDYLSPIQLLCIEIYGFFPVRASDGSNWLINPFTRIQSALERDTNLWWCLTAEDPDIPSGDIALGILLLLENNVEEFRAKALSMDSISDLEPAAEQLYNFLGYGKEDDRQFFNPACCGHNDTPLCDYHKGLSAGLSTGIIFSNTCHVPKKEGVDLHIVDAVNTNVAMRAEIEKNDSFSRLLFELLDEDPAAEEVKCRALRAVIKSAVKQYEESWS